MTNKTSDEIFLDVYRWMKGKDRINEERAKEFEATYYEEYRWLPTKTTSGKWVCFEKVYVRYEAVRKSYIKIHDSGAMEVTDPYHHYIRYEYATGQPLEILTEEEYRSRQEDETPILTTE